MATCNSPPYLSVRNPHLRGPRATVWVADGPLVFGAKLSESRVNGDRGVNAKAVYGRRAQRACP